MADDLDARLLRAHLGGDVKALVSLYEEAASEADLDGRSEAAGFYMTHAYVFALEAGMARAPELKRWLIERQRETEG